MDDLTLGLEDAASYWHAVVKSASLGVWDYNLITGEKRYSSIWREIRHLSPTDPLPANDEEWFSSIHPDDVGIARYNTELINQGLADLVSFEYRERNRNGRWIWIMCRGRALNHDFSGRATRFVGIDSDISEVKEAEQARALNAKQLEIAVTMAGIGIWKFDYQTESVCWDARMREIYSVPATLDPLPRDMWERSIHPDDRARVLASTQEGEEKMLDYFLDYRIIRLDGEVRHIRSRVGFIKDGLDGFSIIGVNWDVTDDLMRSVRLDELNRIAVDRLEKLTQAHDKLERISRRDYLTGLLNRRSLDDYLVRIQSDERQTSEIAFIMLDIDHFKKINDTYGHAFGDKLLQVVSNALDCAISPHGLLARTGGDEFLAIVVDPGSDALPMSIAFSAIAKAREVSLAIGHEITLSAGVDIGCLRIKTVDEFFACADRAMYEAKRNGGAAAVLASS
ncbi:sensor domain-containing diguanylate cyclase [Cypionkella sinensis]|uniref:Diguanylate cyclase domain-containing protein n=1 Tax=Cypionkella sinensis TaxID=1756043 RepID=A0ABV7J377_9RHOB